MFCPKCGNEIPDNAKFCDKCGQQMKSAAEEKAQETKKSQKKKNVWKKVLLGIGGVILVAVLGIGAAILLHEHEWTEATCTQPKVCVKCGKTEGEALGHNWTEATCTQPKTCSVCGETEGEILDHSWIEATCTEPKTCSTCGKTEGEALGHNWEEATCTSLKTCKICGTTTGGYREHSMDSSGKCTMCGAQIRIPLTLDNYQSYLSFYISDSKSVLMVEPVGENDFSDVRISASVTWINKSNGLGMTYLNEEFELNNAGKGGLKYSDVTEITRYQVKSIEGYVYKND